MKFVLKIKLKKASLYIHTQNGKAIKTKTTGESSFSTMPTTNDDRKKRMKKKRKKVERPCKGYRIMSSTFHISRRTQKTADLEMRSVHYVAPY